MTADEVIALRKLWDQFNYRSYLPEATVLASRDWINYVKAMTDLIPIDEPFVNYPSEEEARWEWQEGVALVMDEPFTLDHTIVSKMRDPFSGHYEVPPTKEPQTLAGLVFGIGQMMPTKMGGDPSQTIKAAGLNMPSEVYAIPVMWIGTEPSDIVTSAWIPGGRAIVQGEARYISESTRFVISVITALGHRLTELTEPIYSAGRGERRRVKRELPNLRVLSLRSGASVRSQEGAGAVAWSKRWLVRGHWRNQPYGPQMKLRRIQWIDPFVKGPEDKPFDDRPTLWKTE